MRTIYAAAILAFALTGCDRRPDVFGSNYDACLLQNATKGGDTDSRAIATSVCERHFQRDLKPGARADIQVVTTLMPNAEQFNAPSQDEIKLEVWNREPAMTILKMRATIIFYKSRDGKGRLQDQVEVLEWQGIKLGLRPDDYNTTTLTFQGSKAPSPYFEAFVSPSVVINHGNPRR